MSNVEVELKRLHKEVTEFCQGLEEDPLPDCLSETIIFHVLELFKHTLDEYLDYFEENYDELPSFKRVLYDRQKATLVKKCSKIVEKFGYDYDTDFQFAFELEESFVTVIDQSNELDKYSSVSQLNLEDSFKEIEQNETLIHRAASISKIVMTDNFDLKLANSLIPDFDGSHKEVNDFLDKIEFYHGQLATAGQKALIKFILLMKLKSKVKDQISLNPEDTTFAVLKQTMLDRFSDKTTEGAKTNQIERLTQTDTVANFATKLEVCCAELVRLKMKGRVETARETIQSEVDKLAIRVFTRGLKRTEVKQALIYKEPATFKNAVTFALEADDKFRDDPQFHRVNAFTHKNHRNNSPGSSNSQRRTNQGNWRDNRGRGRGNSSNFSNRGRQNYDNRYRNNNNHQRRRQHNNQNGNNQNGNYQSGNYQNTNNQNNSNQNNTRNYGSRTFTNSNSRQNNPNRNSQYVNQLTHQGNETVPQQSDQPTTRLGDIRQ